MSASYQPRASSRSNLSRGSRTSDGQRAPFASSHSIDDDGPLLDPCAATASFFLFAQGKEIVCVHHDTLQVERRFQKHKEDVRVMAADNASELGTGRQVVSYDNGMMAIVWDLVSGDELSCFTAYEKILVAAFMRDGTIAFGNDKGNIILFEPTTSEHVSARTIFDPVTALAPLTDLRTFAIGYKNGSILIANIKPQFNVLHTLTTARGPSPVTGLAWHGSSSKSKTDMLATQTAEGDLRVWSVPKSPNGDEMPRSIRSLSTELGSNTGRNWLAWSKNGRILEHIDGETRSWDVRTKKVMKSIVPTVANVQGIANCGPTATLFTIGPNYMIQQYDLNPEEGQMSMVANVQHPPTLPPPTPPDSLQDTHSGQPTPDLGRTSGMLSPSPPPAPPSIDVESSEEEGGAMSPLQKIAQEMDAIEDERRDQVTPLSPISSHASMSSRSSYRSRNRGPSSRRRERGVATPDSDGTRISIDSPVASMYDGSSLLSTSSQGSGGGLSRNRRRTPHRESSSKKLDLFPQTRRRLLDVKFRTPKCPPGGLSPDTLRREMLSVIFGWDHDIDTLIHDEYARHRKGSDGAVLLGKWLGELDADVLANPLGSEAMSSSDWMMLALSSQMGGGDQGRKLGEAFVKKLVESGQTHQAVALMLGLGDTANAVELYSSKGLELEATLLCCLTAPQNWQRISSLIRQWGGKAAQNGEAELAVRCFACTGMEYSESFTASPSSSSSNPAVREPPLSPPTSPPSAGNPNRLTAKNASLKLITTFGDRGRLQSQKLGETPIAESAVSQILSPGAGGFSTRSRSKGTNRDPSTARTATPGGFIASRRAASSQRSDVEATPRDPKTVISPRSDARYGATSIDDRSTHEGLSKPTEAFGEHRRNMSSLDASLHQDLRLNLDHSKAKSEGNRASSRGATSTRSRSKPRRESEFSSRALEPPDTATTGELSPLTTDGSMRSYKARRIDRYIESLEQATAEWSLESRPSTRNEPRPASRRSERSRSRVRQSHASHTSNHSESRVARSETPQIPPSKRSPSSPVPMNPNDATGAPREYDDERYYGITSPVDDTAKPRDLDTELKKRQHLSADSKSSAEMSSRPETGRSSSRPGRETIGDRARARSSSRKPESRRAISPERASIRSTSSRRPHINRSISEQEMLSPASSKAGAFSSRQSAQKELEERRLSLARRPSVPIIPMPGEWSKDNRPSPTTGGTTFLITEDSEFRSQTVDPAEMMRYAGKNGIPSTPMGLPSTPRAMKHPSNSMQSDGQAIPAVPALPSNIETLQPITYGQAPNDDGGQTLLPSTVYQAAQRRSMSAPPENHNGRLRRTSFTSRNHGRKSSKLQTNERNSEHDVVVLEEAEEQEEDYVPPVLPELQHLNGPPRPPPTLSSMPPPPPPPQLPKLSTTGLSSGMSPASAGAVHSSGFINIGMDGSSTSRNATPATQASYSSSSPASHRRGQSNNDGFGSKWRSMTDRIRSSSKGRTQRAAENVAASPQSRSPYETVVGNSAYFPSMGENGHFVPPPPSTSAPIEANSPASRNGYRNPKEIRAAMNADVTGGMI